MASMIISTSPPFPSTTSSSSSSPSLSSLLATHSRSAGALLLFFQPSNPNIITISPSSSSFYASSAYLHCPFISHRRPWRRLPQHCYRFSAVVVQHDDSEKSRPSPSHRAQAPPSSFFAFNDSGRSLRSSRSKRDAKSSQEGVRSNVGEDFEDFEADDDFFDRELPWESSDKPSALGFDLTLASAKATADSKVARSPELWERENGTGGPKKRQPFPVFDAKSQLKAPWDQRASARPGPRQEQRKRFGERHEIPSKTGHESDVEEEGEVQNSEDADWEGSAMAQILGRLDTTVDSQPRRKIRVSDNAEADDVFTRSYSSSLEFDDRDFSRIRFPWEREKQEKQDEKAETIESPKRLRDPYKAELVLSEVELKRLKNLSLRATFRLKIGKDGVTPPVLEGIQQHWRQSEIVRIKCEGPPANNMKKTHEELEEKSGGLVVWRAGSALVLYRGPDYGSRPVVQVATKEEKEEEFDITEVLDSETDSNEEDKDTRMDSVKETRRSGEDKVKQEYIKELETILDGLGPRYEGWHKGDPVPVDGDLLAEFITDFKPPIRRVPYRMRAKLNNTELTALRRVARPLPPHFVLGRNRNLEGLASAIIKLWEKSEVVKISVKRGVQNTRNERMAEELKRLTGGVLLSRDKYFIVIYRGKDFLPPSVAEVLSEREELADALQEDEERTRMRIGKRRAEAFSHSSTIDTLELREDEEQDRMGVAKSGGDKSAQEGDEEQDRMGVRKSEFDENAQEEDEEQDRMGVAKSRADESVQQEDEEQDWMGAGEIGTDEDTEQEDNEQDRMGVDEMGADKSAQLSAAGTLAEALEVRSKWESLRSPEVLQKDRDAAERAAQLYELRSMERRLEIAILKKNRAEFQLAKVQKDFYPAEAPADREAITDEEKFMFRKLGLKMKAYLLIGRRGVFDGVVQNMHLHWKHRELVKIILKERDMLAAEDTARMLEYESGGILIDVVRVTKGQAIIVYRGKNYERPPQLRPANLLTKRKALQRSLELQRRQSLEENIEVLKREVYKIKKRYGLFQEQLVKQAQDSTGRVAVQLH